MEPLRTLVEPIYALRNRIAHHEPVWRQSAARRRDDMVHVIRQSSPNLASWGSVELPSRHAFRRVSAAVTTLWQQHEPRVAYFVER